MTWLLLFWAYTHSAVAQCSVGEPFEATAAECFDAGLEAFEQGRHLEAARAFLAADDRVPNVDALRNALAAALASEDDPVLSARIAQRVLERPDSDDAMHRAAQDALDSLRPALAQVTVSCGAASCEPEVDGEAVATGELVYTVPGEHRVGLVGETRYVAVQCAAGQACPLVVGRGPLAPLTVESTASATNSTGAVPTAPAATPFGAAPDLAAKAVGNSAAGVQVPASAGAPAPVAPTSEPRLLPLSVLVASGAGALLLVGAGTYAGVQAVDAKGLYDSDRAEYEPERVQSWATRANLYFAGAALLTGVAVFTGLWWIDWDTDLPSASLSAGGDVFVSTRHHF